MPQPFVLAGSVKPELLHGMMLRGGRREEGKGECRLRRGGTGAAAWQPGRGICQGLAWEGHPHGIVARQAPLLAPVQLSDRKQRGHPRCVRELLLMTAVFTTITTHIVDAFMSHVGGRFGTWAAVSAAAAANMAERMMAEA